MIELTVYGDPASCRSAASEVSRLASATRTAAGDVRSVAAGSSGFWEAPSGEAFRDRAGDLVDGFTDVEERLTRLSAALTTFADQLATVRSRLASVRDTAGAAGLSVVGDVVHPPRPPADLTDTAAVDAHNARVERYDAAFAAAVDARGLEDTAHDRLGAAVAAVTKDGLVEELLRKLGFLPRDGAGATGTALWASGLGLFGLGFATDWMTRVRYGRFAPRGPGGRYISTQAPRWLNAWRALDGDNWQARPHQAASRQTWNTVGRWGSRAGFAVSFGTAAFDQWQADADDPSLDTDEQVGRAVTKGATTAAGGWAGAWAGAQVGGAVGTAIGGPVGTVVGGAIGGLVGGAVGSGIGSTIGDGLVDVGGEVAEALTFWD